MIGILGASFLAINLVFATFGDSSFNLPKTSFTPHETVYFKMDSSSSGKKERKFDLLNEQKDRVFSLDVAVSGNNPYTYTSIFSAPETSGVYYIDVKLDDGEGITFAGQRNINVVSSGSNLTTGEVKSEAVSENRVNVNTNSSQESESDILSFYADSKDVSIDTADKEQKNDGWFLNALINRLKEFIQGLPSWVHFW